MVGEVLPTDDRVADICASNLTNVILLSLNPGRIGLSFRTCDLLQECGALCKASRL